MSGLGVLASKQPIVSTYGADALLEGAADVRAAYDWHAATFVEQPPLADVRRGFVEAIQARRTPKGCLVAPFGYGKTASAIGLWRAWQTEGLLAVPPISCGSFPDIARGVRDWLTYMLPTRADAIAAAHERFLQGSAEVLARRDMREFGIPFEQGRAAIRDKLERGYLDFEDVSLNLLAFLEQATAVAVDAGFGGLVISIDEFQQLLGNATKGTLVALRQLIWGLRTRELPLGLLLTMDPDTERTLADRAGDILHRIKDDALYLNLQRVYDREFPSRLWAQYVMALGLNDGADTAIDRAALDALGQLCEREDLSNGPRMVINALQLAAARGANGGAVPYSPLDLVDDLIDGSIRFDGDRSILPILLAELLNFPYFQRSAEMTAALKLLTAFPRGCPLDVARRYGLARAWEKLGDELRGDIVTELEEGLTLVELQRVGRPANRLNVLLRRYWMQITDLQLFAEDAPRAFVEIVLPLLFPTKKHDLSGWAGLEKVQLAPDGAYRGTIEGTASARFPLRRLSLAVMADSQMDERRSGRDADLHVCFRLSLDPSAVTTVRRLKDDTRLEVTLALGRQPEGGLRGGLAWIEHYLSPQPLSPALILSLLRYLAREVGSDPNARDQARIDDAVDRLRAWLLAELLPSVAFEAAGTSVVQAGQGGFHEFLFALGVRRWPSYRPIAVHQHWAKLLADYEAALGRIVPAARVGVASVAGTKPEIASILGQARHAGFESRAKQYGGLLRLDRWAGDDGIVTFLPHPAEMRLVAAVRAASPLPVHEVYALLRQEGYAAAETQALIRLASARGLVTESGRALSTPPVPSAFELVHGAQALEIRAAEVGGNVAALGAELATIPEELAAGADPLEIAWRLERTAGQIEQAAQAERDAREARAAAARRRLLETLPSLVPIRLLQVPPDLTRHLRSLETISERQRVQLQRQANNLLASTLPDPDEADVLTRQIQDWAAQSSLTVRWGQVGARIGRLRDVLARLGVVGPTLVGLWEDVAVIAREARGVLAGVGREGLPEVARLEPSVAVVEARFIAADKERMRAFLATAKQLVRAVQETVGPLAGLSAVAYQPDDDEGSFLRLQDATTKAVCRAVAVWNLEVADDPAGKGKSLVRAKLRADIKAAAARSRDSAWLLTSPPVGLSKEAHRTLTALRRRVEAHADQGSTTSASRVARALSTFPPGPADLSVVLRRAGARRSNRELLEDLLRLHREGSLRLSIDVPALGAGD
jgi:hypothetical protein